MQQSELQPLLGRKVRAMVKQYSQHSSSIAMNGVICHANNDPKNPIGIMSGQWYNGLAITSVIHQMGFIVLLVLLGGGSYQPTFFEEDGLMFFDTQADADKAIAECIADVKEAVRKGDMSDEYTTDDYRVVPATLDGTTVRCNVDGDNYIMDRSEDDYTRV